MTLHVRAFAGPADIDALLALQHATAGAAPRWSRAFLASELTDPARAGGHNVVVISDGERVRAGSGYVPAGAAFFAAPSFAADVDAAALLLAELERRAGTADFLRASAFPGELAKAEALANAGFTKRFAFITVARASDPDLPPGHCPFVHTPVADVPLEAMRAAHNLAFAGVPSSPEQSLDETRHTVERLFAPASGVWHAADGSIVGYLWVMRDEDSRGPHAVIDAVGVLPGQRSTGLGAIMVAHALRAAAASLPEVRALIASSNHASLGLHQAAGFAEVWRRDVWQRELHSR